MIRNNPREIDAPPPSDLHAEQAVLGACLLDANAIDTAAIMLSPEHWYSEQHAAIWAAIHSMRESNHPVDVLTLSNELVRRKQLEFVGGPGRLAELMESVPHTFHTEHYAGIVLDRSRRRAAIQAAELIDRQVRDMGTDTDEVLAAAEGAIHKALEHGSAKVDVSIESALMAALASFEDNRAAGIGTELLAVDALLGGMVPGTMVVVGARPSVGKTAFAMTMLRRLGEVGTPGALFSYEMTRAQIAERTLAASTGITVYTLRRGGLTAAQQSDLLRQAEIASKLPIIIDDTVRPLPQLLVAMRTAVRKYKLKVIVIDYMQLVPCGARFGTREQEVAHISRSLQAAAKSLEIVIMVLCQLNRAAELRENQEPRLADLRESGSIEQDATQVMFLWRPNKDCQGRPGDEDKLDDHGFLSVAKNRQGQLGRAKLHWHGPSMTYREWTTPGADYTDERIDSWEDNR